jgi:uncharacterized protein YbjT (DUF2867 family)
MPTRIAKSADYGAVNVLVTGGTGTLGRPLIRALRSAGHRAVVFSRKAAEGPDWIQGDLATGTGLADAVADAEVVVHAGSATTQVRRAKEIDVGGTRRLLNAAVGAGVGHFVFISIVGIDGIDYPYYRAKVAAEALVREGPLPWSVLRATQFHSLIEAFLGRFSRVPGLLTVPFSWKFQPVDAREVAARLLEITVAEPAGMLPDFGGPEVRDLRSLAQAWLEARGSARRLLNLPMPLQFSRKFAEGALLCPDHKDGELTWEQHLERRYGA